MTDTKQQTWNRSALLGLENNLWTGIMFLKSSSNRISDFNDERC